ARRGDARGRDRDRGRADRGQPALIRLPARTVALCRSNLRPSIRRRLPRRAQVRRRGRVSMDVRSIVNVEPEVEHNGTVPVWYLVHPREMKDLTNGGHLELVNEFEVANGGYVYPH